MVPEVCTIFHETMITWCPVPESTWKEGGSSSALSIEDNFDDALSEGALSLYLGKRAMWRRSVSVRLELAADLLIHEAMRHER